jgi:hypothetical protein
MTTQTIKNNPRLLLKDSIGQVSSQDTGRYECYRNTGLPYQQADFGAAEYRHNSPAEFREKGA